MENNTKQKTTIVSEYDRQSFTVENEINKSELTIDRFGISIKADSIQE